MLACVSEKHKRHSRSIALDLLHIPRSHSSFFGRAFSVQGPKLWNSLPADIRNSTSVNRFKSALKRYLLCINQSKITYLHRLRQKRPLEVSFVFRNRETWFKYIEYISTISIGVSIRLIHHSYWDKMLKVVHGGLKIFTF